jgi:23S rRNA G2069 N7-methylase RlmK/C1962 C5-methylase RlmI
MLEGLPEVNGVLMGAQPPKEIEISENGLGFLVDIQHGHKTGFYLDQRDNRLAVQKYAQGMRVFKLLFLHRRIYDLLPGGRRIAGSFH